MSRKMQNLTQISLKVPVQILEVKGPAELCERLLELGLTAGSEVQVLSRIPFNGPLLVKIKGGVVALRNQEAQCVQVTLSP